MLRRLAALVIGLACSAMWAGDELSVLRETPDEGPPGRQLEAYLKREFRECVAQRRRAFAALATRSDCEGWKQSRREFFRRQLGGFPDRTALQPQVVKHLRGNGYRVENILFESRPGHHVTGNLYLPDQPEPGPSTGAPWPAVIIPCGHFPEGKAAGETQRLGILLAKNGIAAFSYDPVGQGERYQMLDYEHENTHFAGVSYPLPVPHPRVRHLCTVEHTTMGLGCIVLGTNIAQYRIWDGMRAIDYLQSRPDIDPAKIGCTGSSGGGTETAYLMALDDRIVAAAPVCFLTTFQRLVDTVGPQDAEQNIFGQIAFGMDEADYVMMRAPRPTLIGAGRRDATFDIEGTWDLFRESKIFYARLGHPERVDLHDADLPHGFLLPQREVTARWMHRWLSGGDGGIQEVDPASLPATVSDKQWWGEYSKGDWTHEDLRCSPEGQVLLMPGEKSVFQLNAGIEAALRPERIAAWQRRSAAERRAIVRRTLGMPEGSSSTSSPVDCRVVGTLQRDGYRIEKLVLVPEAGIALPALSFVPPKPNGTVILYLHGESMQADAGPGGPIESLVREGQVVVSAELRGIGETETGHDKQDYGRGYFGRDSQEIFLAYLLGRSYVGLRTGDVEAWARCVAEFPPADGPPRTILLHAIGEAAIPALHAAALAPERFASIRLAGMIPSWTRIVNTPGGRNQAANVVHGALRHYDLPDLVELCGTEKIRIVEPVDVYGTPATAARAAD